MKKRILSLLLALVLALGTLPAALAEELDPALPEADGPSEEIPQEAPPAVVPSEDGTTGFDGNLPASDDAPPAAGGTPLVTGETPSAVEKLPGADEVPPADGQPVTDTAPETEGPRQRRPAANWVWVRHCRTERDW